MVGDPQRLPHRHLTVQQPGPGPREPVGELDDLPDVVAARVQRPTQQGAELHHREVGDQRCAGSGEREPGVQAPLDQRRRVGFVVDDVFAGPFRDLAERGDLASAITARRSRISASSSSDRDTAACSHGLGRGGGEVEEGCGPEIHETYSIWNIRHNQTPRTRLWTGGSRSVDESGGCLVSRLGAGAPAPQPAAYAVGATLHDHSSTSRPQPQRAPPAALKPGQGRGDSAATNDGEQPRPS